MMRFRGRLILKKVLNSEYHGEYSSVYIAVEIGYGLEYIKMIATDEFVLNQLSAIDIHDTVQAEADPEDEKLFLKNITKSTFEDFQVFWSLKYTQIVQKCSSNVFSVLQTIKKRIEYISSSENHHNSPKMFDF